MDFVPLDVILLTRYDFLLVAVAGLGAFGGFLVTVVLSARVKCRLPYPTGPRRLPVIGNLSGIPRRK